MSTQETKFSRPVKIDLKDCTVEPIAEYKSEKDWTSRPGWFFRLSLRGKEKEVLPLFVHVFYNTNGRLEAEIESDQTDYSKPNWPYSIKRASIKNLKFWK